MMTSLAPGRFGRSGVVPAGAQRLMTWLATVRAVRKILGIKAVYRACGRRQKSVRQFKARAERSVKITARGIARVRRQQPAECLSLASEPNNPARS